jgi:hypothetical protein
MLKQDIHILKLRIRLIAPMLCVVLALTASDSLVGYTVTYSGGSLPTVRPGQRLSLLVAQDAIYLDGNRENALTLRTTSITEVSYGKEVHRRVGTAVAVGVFSLGVGALVALSKSKKHYIGLTWDDAGKKGGLVFQADKNQYRGLIAALEGITGRKAVNTDTPDNK